MQYLKLLSLLAFLGIWGVGCGDLSEAANKSTHPGAIDYAEQELCPLMAELLKPRDPVEFPKELNEAIDAITMAMGTLPVGSYKYKELPYPGDIDIFETTRITLPLEKAKKYFAERLRNIAQRVDADPDLMLADFKAGTDTRLKVDIGSLTDAKEVKDYNPESIRARVASLKAEGLLTAEEAANLESFIKDKPTDEEWLDLKEEFRLHYTLRWTINELLAGKKELRGGKELALADAIDSSMIKIDVYAPVTKTEGYTEVTTFFNFNYIDNGLEKPLTEELPDYKTSVTSDVIKFFDKSSRKHLKGAKRLWLLSTILGDNELTAKLQPLFATSAASLNQVIAESEVIRGILEKADRVPCAPMGHRLHKQLTAFEKRVLDSTEVIDPFILSNNDTGLISLASEALRQSCPRDPNATSVAISEQAKATVTASLEKLEDLLRPIIEDHAKAYLAEAQIDPDKPLDSLTGRQDVCPLRAGPPDEATSGDAPAKVDAEAPAKGEAEAPAKVDAEAPAKVDAEAPAKVEAEAKAKVETEVPGSVPSAPQALQSTASVTPVPANAPQAVQSTTKLSPIFMAANTVYSPVPVSYLPVTYYPIIIF